MSNGVRITDKTALATIDKVLGIKTQGSTAVGPVAFTDFEQQLLAGEIGDEIQIAVDKAEAAGKPVYTLALATTTDVTLSGEQTIDGTVTNLTELLVWTKTDKKLNGIYKTGAGAWSRLSAFNTGTELFGQQFYIKGGSTNATKTFGLQSNTIPVVGTDNLVFDVVKEINTAKPGALDALRNNANAITATATINLETATGEYVPINGDTGISAVTLSANHDRFGIFTGKPLITVGASLIGDNGGQNVQIEAGDIVWFRGETGGVVRFRTYRAVPYNADSTTGDGIAYAVLDRRGRAALSIHDDGSMHTPGGSFVPNEDSAVSDVIAYAVRDSRGRAIFTVHSDGSIHTSTVSIGADGSTTDQPSDLTIFFAPSLCGIEDEEVTVFTEGLLSRRSNSPLVRAFASGDEYSGYQRQDREQLVLRPDRMGAAGRVALRPVNDTGTLYGELEFGVRVAEKNPVSGGSPVILNFGDSIVYRQWAAWTRYFLTAWGYTPTFIGTLAGESGAGFTTNLLGEGKPGHWSGDFTYRVNTRVSPLASGDEAAYAAMSTTDKRLKNTMLQTSGVAAADGGAVNPSDVYNGQYLDFKRYVTRHSLTTPTMLLYNGGTNDLTNMTTGIQTAFYNDLLSIARRWKAAYPTAPFVYFLPPTANATDRNPLWQVNYTEAIKGILRAQAAAVALGVDMIVVPTWATTAIGADFDLTSPPESPDPDLGCITRSIPDAVHVTGAGRSSMFKHVAYAIACAATGA
ncbi:hypothetical protein OIU34_00560 [Pararhizobium sp. BT-229]|uniref:SGNH/GDSL hydrolase family protein n=1 Tax=Pararhizobium sp. BT-229 TaxID=2986923 RepID=UPI0021F772C5|nr:SGNH/GDSL hydrolase family protein [Pararhizobium sp. BT-229]MCV9960377.1 hypothetical protein [Pararhizobium sp. BT-229]